MKKGFKGRGLFGFLVIIFFLSIIGVPFEVAEANDDEDGEDDSVVMSILLYPVNRVLDLFDIFRLNVGVGPGFGLNLRLTKFAQVGIENYTTARAGLGKNSGLLVERYGLLYTETELFTLGASVAYTGGEQRGLTEVGTTLHLLLVGGEAAIDLSEIGDFILGFIAIDYKGDDW